MKFHRPSHNIIWSFVVSKFHAQLSPTTLTEKMGCITTNDVSAWTSSPKKSARWIISGVLHSYSTPEIARGWTCALVLAHLTSHLIFRFLVPLIPAKPCSDLMFMGSTHLPLIIRIKMHGKTLQSHQPGILQNCISYPEAVHGRASCP